MADKLIIDCLTGKVKEQNYTETEKQAIEKQKTQQQLNPSYQTPQVTTSEIQVAQAILAINDRLTKLESK